MKVDAWKAQMLNDFPSVNPYFVDILLKTYETDPEWFAREIANLKREEHRKAKKKETATLRPSTVQFKELVGAVELINDIPEHLRINCDDTLSNETTQDSESVHPEQVQAIGNAL